MHQTQRPSHDQTMLLLGSIMATYSWTEFKPIIYSPDKLQAWIAENLKPDPDTELMLHPDDPKAAELSEMAMDSEDAALEFWGELLTAEQEMLREAFQALWGAEGSGTAPRLIARPAIGSPGRNAVVDTARNYAPKQGNARFAANMDAIRLMRKLGEEKRDATTEGFFHPPKKLRPRWSSSHSPHESRPSIPSFLSQSHPRRGHRAAFPAGAHLVGGGEAE